MKPAEIVLVCSDRDGTINVDRNYYLGKATNWKEQLEFLPGVIEGIKILNDIPNSKLVILTNQPGVAISDKEFEDMTEERTEEVNSEIVKRLKKQGAIIDSYFSCPYVDDEYVKKSEKRGRKLHAHYIDNNHPDRKPNIGMIKKAAQSFGHELKDIRHKFMIGDRYSDLIMGLNAGCISFQIHSHQTEQDKEFEKIDELQKKHPDKIFIMKDFLEAAKMIKEFTK